MHNEHVTAYWTFKASEQGKLLRLLGVMAQANIGRPARVWRQYFTHQMIVEVVRQINPPHVLKIPRPVLPY